MKDLGTLGGINSDALAINELDQIVGQSNTASGQLDAFIYSNGVMQDLNALLPANSGITLSFAQGINDVGQIVATGTDANGVESAFLLTPTPEPSSSLLLAAAALVLLRRRTIVVSCQS